ncbi:MAG: glycosyltransferase family 2 protein [Lachnospiraceae bacterium]|nr:glycosyltransferase family 2 protein [Lachnospiraceae bacterium]
MAVLILILKIYCVFIVVLMTVYSIRHYVLTDNRLHKRQRIAYGDIYDSELPYVSVLVPMHNEEKVLNNVLSSLLACDYDKDRMEIIAINDHSDDKTAEMLDAWHEKYPFINVLHRRKGNQGRGKMYGLNDAMEIAKGDVIIVFDADYTPSTGLVRKLAMAFIDPTVGAVMGRVIPRNATKNHLTSFLNLERIGGYQVDMQARYNLGLIA